ncbi:hypothetical protein McPS_20540 [Marichromatium sp. PS1]
MPVIPGHEACEDRKESECGGIGASGLEPAPIGALGDAAGLGGLLMREPAASLEIAQGGRIDREPFGEEFVFSPVATRSGA